MIARRICYTSGSLFRLALPARRVSLYTMNTLSHPAKLSTVTSVNTEKAYAPFAHYSQAIKAGGHVWLSGQIPADVDGKLIKGSTVEKTKTIVQNTEAILKEAGSGVVKVVVYLKNANMMPDFTSVV